MKTKLLLLLLLANFSFYAQTNLVPNGDFESWSSSTPTDWFRNFSGFVSESSVAQSGSSSAKLLITSSANFLNSAYFQAQAGKTYRVTVYHRVASGTLTNIELSLYHKPSTFKSELVKKDDAIFSSTTWRKLEFEYTTTATEDIEVDIWATGVTNSEILLDNVSVVDVNEPVYTSIPDVNFENKLIAYGIDSGAPDGKVLTSSVSAVKNLDLENSNIADLTGIQDFLALDNLFIRKNKLTTIDLSKNTKLTYLNISENQLTSLNINANILLEDLDCQENNLTSLNVSSNTKLKNLNVDDNQLTSLNVSNNTALEFLYCSINKIANLNIDNNIALLELSTSNNLLTSLNISKNIYLRSLVFTNNQISTINVSNNTVLNELMFHNNKIKTIDISNNPELTYLVASSNELKSIDISKNLKIFEVVCDQNQLTYLNLKNGNNTNFDLFYSSFKDNPNLTCIVVDDVAHSNANWTALKDATASYSAACTLGLETSVFEKVALYPNPTKGDVTITNLSLNKATVYNSTGQLIKSFTLDTANTNNTISLSGLPKGIYYVYLINQDAASAKKVIVE